MQLRALRCEYIGVYTACLQLLQLLNERFWQVTNRCANSFRFGFFGLSHKSYL